VHGQLVVGISPSSNGRYQMDATGTDGCVPVQSKRGTFQFYNGRERMDVSGAQKHIKQL